jgi:hypothetical protein
MSSPRRWAFFFFFFFLLLLILSFIHGGHPSH